MEQKARTSEAYRRFRELAGKLVSVPKHEVDEKRLDYEHKKKGASQEENKPADAGALSDSKARL